MDKIEKRESIKKLKLLIDTRREIIEGHKKRNH